MAVALLLGLLLAVLSGCYTPPRARRPGLRDTYLLIQDRPGRHGLVDTAKLVSGGEEGGLRDTRIHLRTATMDSQTFGEKYFFLVNPLGLEGLRVTFDLIQ